MDKLIISGPESSSVQTYALEKDSILIGRQPYCDLVLSNNTVSREHARLTKLNEFWQIEDQQSRNGVKVNSKRIGYDPVTLHDGDEISIGEYTIYLALDEPSRILDAKDDSSLSKTILWHDDLVMPRINSQVAVAPEVRSSKPGEKSRKRSVDYQREINLLEERLRVLLDFARNLGKAEDLDDLAPRFLKSILRLFPQADSACVMTPNDALDKQGESLWRLSNYMRRDNRVTENVRVSRSILRHVIETRSAALYDAEVNGSTFLETRARRSSSPKNSVMAAPIYDVTNDVIVGVIQVDARESNSSFDQKELNMLVAVANQAAVYWENQRYRDQAIESKLATRELQFAYQIQRDFLPLEPPKIDGYEFCDYYRPAKIIGGDYFDYLQLPDGQLAIVLGDVSGKGAAAALLMVRLSAEVKYSLALESSCVAATTRLNKAFCENHWGDRFVTFVLLILDPKTGVVRLCNAGHLYPLLSKCNGEVEQIGVDRQGCPLGVTQEITYQEITFELQPGETIALMSDGFSDALSPAYEAFGEKRIIETLRNRDGQDVATVRERLVSKVRAFSEGQAQTDDQCLTLIRRLPD